MRAKQHLIVQNMTVYDCPTAVCVRRSCPSIMDGLDHFWAVSFNKGSLVWINELPDTDPLKEKFLQAYELSKEGEQHVLAHGKNILLIVPMIVDEVRTLRARLEKAFEVGSAPVMSDLSAVPDEMIESEIKRRSKAAKNQQNTDPTQ